MSIVKYQFYTVASSFVWRVEDTSRFPRDTFDLALPVCRGTEGTFFMLLSAVTNGQKLSMVSTVRSKNAPFPLAFPLYRDRSNILGEHANLSYLNTQSEFLFPIVSTTPSPRDSSRQSRQELKSRNYCSAVFDCAKVAYSSPRVESRRGNVSFRASPSFYGAASGRSLIHISPIGGQ